MADAQRNVALSQYKIKIDGAEPAEEFTDAIIEVVVDERLNLPTMVEIRLHDPEFKWADGAVVAEGKAVEVFGGDQANISVGGGEITSIEGNFGDAETQLLIRGYDRSFRLHRGIKHRSFLNVSDSDLVNRLASEAGLTAEVEATTEVYPYVLQYNETNFSFLQRRAARIGFDLAVVGQKLVFRKPAAGGSPVTTLELGTTLSAFRPQRSVGEQVDQISVKDWDVKLKQAIVGNATGATNLNTVGDGKTGGAAAKTAFSGAAKRYVIDTPVANQRDAETVAKALLQDLNAEFVRAEGETSKEPKIRVGKLVTIEKVGTRFGGDYYVTAVTHRFGKEFGHKVEFSASTRRPSPLAGLMTPPEDRRRIEGVVIGLVTINKDDEEKEARVKVKYPWSDFGSDAGTEGESHWARLAMPMAGPDRGFLTIPEVNDEVLVAFEHGDPTRPFVVGALWNGLDKPPKGPDDKAIDDIISSDGKVDRRYWRSRTGHVIGFDDSADAPMITIMDKTKKNYIKIISTDNKLEVQIEGDIQVTSETGKIDVKADKDITFQSVNGKISMKAKMDVATESETGKVAIKAATDFDVAANANVKMAATAQMKLTATGPAELATQATMKLTANGPAEMASQATTKVSGNGMVDVNSSGIVNIKGSLIKLN